MKVFNAKFSRFIVFLSMTIKRNCEEKYLKFYHISNNYTLYSLKYMTCYYLFLLLFHSRKERYKCQSSLSNVIDCNMPKATKKS